MEWYQHIFNKFGVILILATLLRVVLLVYSEYQDANYEVKYTDIDYEVFTDAARYVAQGQSPYLRATYRYTPLLAIALTPNVWLHKSFGKILFVLADLYAGVLLSKICQLRKVQPYEANKLIAISWLLNPFVANISTRGNAESLLVVIILASFHALLVNKFFLGCFLYGLSVHLKIYPIIYALPLVLFINQHHPRQRNLLKKLGKRPLNRTRSGTPELEEEPGFLTVFFNAVWLYVKLSFQNIFPKDFFMFFTKSRIQLGLFSGGTFLLLNLLMYSLYGMEFLEHTYFYHVTRRDHRHNFSIWFYPIYLSASSPIISDKLLGLTTFIPQFLVTGYFGWAYSKDIFFACFLQTAAFVALNKVCTSQYFMWYLGLLPLVLTSTSLKFRWQGAKLLVLWIFGQAIWLCPAYFLEFQGYNTFILIWLASLVFFGINLHLMIEFINHHYYRPIFLQGQIVST